MQFFYSTLRPRLLLLAGATLLLLQPFEVSAGAGSLRNFEESVVNDASSKEMMAHLFEYQDEEPSIALDLPEDHEEGDHGRRLWSYPKVTIKNDTPYPISGDVKYLGCYGSDYFIIQPGKTWTAFSYRGLCLITKISGYGVKGTYPDDEFKKGIAYESSGTSYSQFKASLRESTTDCYSEMDRRLAATPEWTPRCKEEVVFHR